MARNLTAGILAEIVRTGADVVRPEILWSGAFPGGTAYFWTGVGDLVHGGNPYTGVGTIVSVGVVEETVELKATGYALMLSGIPSSVVALAETEEYQGKAAVMQLAFLDASGAVIADPIDLPGGSMDVMETDEGGETSTIKLSVESDFAAMFRKLNLYYTPEDQKARYPGDTFFDYVAGLVDKEIVLEG